MSSKEIAKEIGLTPRTVDQYVSVAAQALGASNRRDAARKLASLEIQPLNKFQLKSAAIDPVSISDTIAQANPDSPGVIRRFLRWLPPLGGARDELSTATKVQRIVKAAVVAAVGFGSIVATGAWLQSLFS